MKVSRGGRTAAVVALGALAVFAAFAYVERAPILERWYLWRLDSRSDEARSAALAGLGRFGFDRAVPPLLDRLWAREDVGRVLAALRGICPRAGRESRDAILEKLFEMDAGD